MTKLEELIKRRNARKYSSCYQECSLNEGIDDFLEDLESLKAEDEVEIEKNTSICKCGYIYCDSYTMHYCPGCGKKISRI